MKNGTSQATETVIEKGEKYILTYQTRSYSIRKTLVARIEKLS